MRNQETNKLELSRETIQHASAQVMAEQKSTLKCFIEEHFKADFYVFSVFIKLLCL